MKVILFRHATRSMQALSDCSLNQIGKTQAETLASKWVSPHGSLPKPSRLIASPKKRAQESFGPLAQALGLKVEANPFLDERHQPETQLEFTARVKKVIEQFSQEQTAAHTMDSTVYLCSHLDWIETFIALVPSDLPELERQMGFSTLEFKVFQIKDGFWMHLQSGCVEGAL